MVNTAVAVFTIMVVFIVSIYRLEYGIYAVMGELVIGSQGYIFSIDFPQFNLSLRLGLFLAVFTAWIVHAVHTKRLAIAQSKFWPWYLALILTIIIGAGVGFWHNNSLHNIFFDGNGYLFLGLIFPFAHAIQQREQLQKIFSIILAGVIALALETVVILFMYSHLSVFQWYIPELYRWIRDFRLGEITAQSSGFTRVFFQSHIFIVYTLFISLFGVLLLKKHYWYVFLGLASTLIFISYSRTFWVATFAALIICAIYLKWFHNVGWLPLAKLYSSMMLLFMIGYCLILLIIKIPLFNASGLDISANALLSDRTEDFTTDAAAGSRMALLQPLFKANLNHAIVGAGLGATVSYQTKDPRALASNPNGLYTTYAFEWGYLDLWLKLGIAGLITYLLLLVSIIRRGHVLSKRMQLAEDKTMILGVVVSVVALAGIHGLTPYLNHPLGISWIILATTLIDIYEAR
jgi:hypothetical protein